MAEACATSEEEDEEAEFRDSATSHTISGKAVDMFVKVEFCLLEREYFSPVLFLTDDDARTAEAAAEGTRGTSTANNGGSN